MEKSRRLPLILSITISLIALFSLTGCKTWERAFKDFESSISGLDRVVTVYDNGEVIRTYRGKIDIEVNEYGNKVKFDVNGKRVIIYNAVVVVEEQ